MPDATPPTDAPGSDPIDAQKRALRASVRAALAAITSQDRDAWSSLLCARLDGLDALASPRVVVAFTPLPTEPDIAPLLPRLHARGIRVAIPRVDWATSTMRPALVSDLDHNLVPTRHGLREPRPDLPIAPPEEVDAILVPGLAFDPTGARLGRGGGFYDRFLGDHERAVAIGVAFDLQVVPRIPTHTHDRRVRALVTPSGVRWWGSG